MAFQPMLVIGCGGSGGATLQYMMDSLRTELSRRLEKAGEPALTSLPGAWQFVHVDVPNDPDGDSEERPATVREQGGVYVGLARPGLTWPMVSQAIWSQTKDSRPDLTSGWMRRPKPSGADTPLQQGAGQERAVGRGVTLNSLPILRAKLHEVAGLATGAAAMKSLRDIADPLAIPVHGTPIVIIVSSMAGGSGASMVLDIPRILAGFDQSFASHTSMFLYTSEVFGSIPAVQRSGVEANGLAMMGELLSTSLGSSDSDHELFELLGIAGQEVALPFKRVFPIGMRSGLQGAIFADGELESVYRAVGRALAGLTASSVAMEQFLSYDLANNVPLATNDMWMGEGTAGMDSLLWGTFGYARLSLGRDRYGEYVAQLIARQAVDRLVAGHQTGNEDAGQADLQRAGEDAHNRVVSALGLPSEGSRPSAFSLLARDETAEDEAKRGLRYQMKAVVDREVFGDGLLSRPLSGERYVRQLRQVLGQTRTPVERSIREAAYERAEAWQDRLVHDILLQIEVVLATQGLPVARKVVQELKSDVSGWIRALQSEAASPQCRPWEAVVPDGVVRDLGQAQVITPGDQLQAQLARGLADRLTGCVVGDLCRLMIQTLEDFGPSFADPLAAALDSAHRSLQDARQRNATLGGHSDLRTSSYADWPRPDQRVPQRFRGAHNEVVLLDADDFPQLYEAHINSMAETRTGLSSTREAEDLALSEVLRDTWLAHNDSSTSSGIIKMVTRWTPTVLTSDPRKPGDPRLRSSASFELSLSPVDIVSRARDWVWRQDGEFGPYLSVGLAEYMKDPDALDFHERLRRLVSRFEEVMTQALPLVAVDPEAYSMVHQAPLSVSHKFSSVPFQDMGTVVADLEQKVLGTVSPASRIAFSRALGPASNIDHIDVFTSFPPMSPLAFQSLLQPLVNAWKTALAQGSAVDFWTGRRAHALPASIPMSPAERRAVIAGYVIAKMTGRIRGSYKTEPHRPSEPLEIFDESEGLWRRFPHPLLTPYSDGYEADELPALLESYVLAMAECGQQRDLSPLLPYIRLRHTFAKVVEAQGGEPADNGNRTFDRSTGNLYLQRWIADGWRPPGAPTPSWAKGRDGSALDLSKSTGRAEAARTFLTEFRDAYASYYHTEDQRLFARFKPYNRRPLMGTIAPDFVWALDEIRGMVDKLDFGEGDHTDDRPPLVM